MKTVYHCKEIGCPVLFLNVDVFYVHFPDCIGCIHANNGFHYPSGRTAIIVCVIQKAVLLHDAEDLLPVNVISGSLQVFADLLETIGHERIHPATPKEDAHIESFNSILEKEVIRRFEFSSFEDAESTISRFIEFYNNERLHSAIDYKAPREVYEKWKENIIEGPA